MGSTFELSVGGFFGERALLTNQGRAATIKCASAEAECLTLSREDFTILLGPLEDIMQRNLDEYEKPENVRKPIGHRACDAAEKGMCALSELKCVGILGRGAFGTVKLVLDPSGDSYALKAIRKNQVVELGQQSHILNEKKVMTVLDNKFLVNLRATYKDDFRVYFLLEVCLGSSGSSASSSSSSGMSSSSSASKSSASSSSSSFFASSSAFFLSSSSCSSFIFFSASFVTAQRSSPAFLAAAGSSVMMTLSKMVPDLTCQRSNPILQFSSYLAIP